MKVLSVALIICINNNKTIKYILYTVVVYLAQCLSVKRSPAAESRMADGFFFLCAAAVMLIGDSKVSV